MKTSLAGLFLLSITSAAISAPAPTEAKPWPNGSREHRPVIKEPTPGSTAGLPHRENASPLVVAQLATIQGVGRNVLAAKHSVKPDPALEAMREQLKAVSSDLIQVARSSLLAKPVQQQSTQSSSDIETQSSNQVATAFTPTTPPVKHLVPGSAPNTFVEEAGTPSASSSTPLIATATPSAPVTTPNNDAWRSDTASLQNRLTHARMKTSAMPDVTDANRPRHRDLAQKQSLLFDDIQRAVNARDTAQLAELRERLTPRSLPEERKRLQTLADPHHKIPSAAPTPTVSILTKHR